MVLVCNIERICRGEFLCKDKEVGCVGAQMEKEDSDFPTNTCLVVARLLRRTEIYGT